MNIKAGDRIRITERNCGRASLYKLSTMGIREGTILDIVAIQPAGPIVVRKDRIELSIGRGIFKKLEYELIL